MNLYKCILKILLIFTILKMRHVVCYVLGKYYIHANPDEECETELGWK